MIYTSLAIVMLSASTALSPLSNLMHFHPHGTKADTRVSVTLYNNAALFRDVKVDGRVYSVRSHGTLTIKAPVGTVVYAASRTPTFHRGDVVLQVTPRVDNTQITLN